MAFLQELLDELGRWIRRALAAIQAYITWFERTNRGRMRQVLLQHFLTLLLGILVGYQCSRLGG